jgi:outer membrane protein assembly factor BamB/PKD repeat protein
MWEISRRKLVSTLLWTAAGATAGVGTARSTARQSADSWPQARFDPAGTAHTSATGAPGTGEPPGIAWETDRETGGNAAPVAGDGRLFLPMAPGSDDDDGGRLGARRLDDGSLRWETDVVDAVGGSPAFADGRVYAADYRGAVHALSGDDGTRVWSADGFDFSIGVPVVAHGGSVYVGDTDGMMYRLDGESGSVEWSETLTGRVINAPAVAGGTVYVGTVAASGDEHAVYALDAETGDRQWSVDTPLDVPTVPAVRDGSVYVCAAERAPSRGLLLALDAADGTERWRWDDLGAISSPAVDDQRVYVIEGMDVRAFGIESGLEAWRYSGSAASVSRRDPGPVVADGTVYASPGSNAGLLAFEAESGDVRWHFEALPVDAPLAVVGDRVYARGSDRTTEAGRLWAIEEGGTPFPRPAFSVSPEQPRTDEPAVLDASESTVPGGEIDRYEWDVRANGDVDHTGERVEHVFETDGPVEVGLTVTSAAGVSASITDHVSVDGRPRLSIEADPSEPAPGEEITFEATATIRVETFQWAFGDGTTATGQRVTHTYTAPGEYEVRLGDSDGVETTTTVVVRDRSEEIAIEYTPSDPAVGEQVTFEVDGPDGEYTWAFGDGTTATGARVTHQYESAGEYTVELTSSAGERQTTVSVGTGDGDGTDVQTSGPTDAGGSDGLPFDTDLLVVGGAGGLATLLGTYAFARRRGEPVDDRIEEHIDESERQLETVREARADRAYDRTLEACEAALDAGEAALELARREETDRVDEIEDRVETIRRGLEAIRTERDAYDRTTRGLEAVAARLDDVETTVDSGPDDDARRRLDDIGEALDSASDLVQEHEFTELEARLDTLRDRREALLDRIDRARRRAASDAVPEGIPTTPHRSITYDDLRKEDAIGSGGNADVYRATVQPESGEAVTLAVKEPRMSGTLHTDAVERLIQEAETWQSLDDHDHVVSVVDYGAQPLPWIAMEYMDSGHLGDRAGDLPLEQALWTAVSITRGVRHAHRNGVAHLDLKPENVLFRSAEGAWDVPKVADWGLSKHLLEHSKSIEGLSPHYAAPEQFDDDYGAVDDLTDVYQLGAVFYDLFTGRPPFDGRPTEVMRAVIDDSPVPPSEIADTPEALDDILLRAMAKEKADRYESVLYLRDELQAMFDERT